MPLDARKILAFSDALNAKWWPALEKCPREFLDSKVDFSFLTPLGLLTHNANIEHAYCDVMEGGKPQWARHSTKEWHELAPVLTYAKSARERTHRNVDPLDQAGLGRSCVVGDIPGFARPAFTIEELLFVIFTHEQWHRGELLAAFWHANIEPPPLDYPRYGVPLTVG